MLLLTDPVVEPCAAAVPWGRVFLEWEVEGRQQIYCVHSAAFPPAPSRSLINSGERLARLSPRPETWLFLDRGIYDHAVECAFIRAALSKSNND